MATTDYNLIGLIESMLPELEGEALTRAESLLLSLQDPDADEENKALDVDKLIKELSGLDREKSKSKFQDGYLERKISEIANAALSTINAFSDISTGNKQVKEARENINRIVAPEGVKPLKRSANLANLNRISQDRLNPSYQESATQGLKADILDQDFKNKENARIASGGQAGAFGSISQAAANARFKSALALQDQKRAMGNDAFRNSAALAGMEIQENNAYANNDVRRAYLDDARYARDSEAAGKALVSGMRNQRTGRLEMFNALPQFIPAISREIRGGINPNINPTSSGARRGNYTPKEYRYDVDMQAPQSNPNMRVRSFKTDQDFLDFDNDLNNGRVYDYSPYANTYGLA